MDLRTERTKRSIANAFLELRKQKPIEKITVKELAELAFINKATCYVTFCRRLSIFLYTGISFAKKI